jgi:hypothetical protein
MGVSVLAKYRVALAGARVTRARRGRVSRWNVRLRNETPREPAHGGEDGAWRKAQPPASEAERRRHP